MKRILLAMLCTLYCSTASANWLQKIPIDLPIHSITAINFGTFVGVIAEKHRVYKKLRALLLEQIVEEEERTNKQRTPEENLFDDVGARIKKASNKQLIRFAFEIANMREGLEAEIGEYEIAKRLGGAEQSKRERERVAQCKRLAQDAMIYEMWQPQLRTALFGTGAISALMALHRLGVFGGVK